MRPEASRSATVAGGRSSATASPVTRSSSPRSPCTSDMRRSRYPTAGPLRRAYSDPRGHRRLRGRARRPLAPARGAQPGAVAERARGRRARRRLPGGRHPPVRRTLLRTRRRPGGLPLQRAGPGPHPHHRHPHHVVARRRPFLTATFPAALYRIRRWWLAVLLANVAVAGADDGLAGAAPRHRVDVDVPGRGRPARQRRLRAATTASTPPRTSPRRCGPTTPGSRRCASPWECSGCRSCTCCSTTS